MCQHSNKTFRLGYQVPSWLILAVGGMIVFSKIQYGLYKRDAFLAPNLLLLSMFIIDVICH